MTGRRSAIARIGRIAAAGLAWAGDASTTHALPPRTLAFPRDHGAHPGMRTEWWYVTGYAATPQGREFGFQVTFFSTRVDAARALSSRFAARQLLFAHAAVTDLAAQRLLHDQRIARAGFGIAEAAEEDAAIRIRNWTLRREADASWAAQASADTFTLALRLSPTQPLLLQGEQGLSRKGPQAAQASYYYSIPQLAVQARIGLARETFDAQGRAWLDHEWSEELLHPQAVGWDWIGMNLEDGAALTAFRLRRADGTALWDGGSFRPAGGAASSFGPARTMFTPLEHWTSPRSRARYPVRWQLTCPAGTYTVRALLPDQELDSRASTGAIYWEGLSELLDANGVRVGRGYLEMTGYAAPLRL